MADERTYGFNLDDATSLVQGIGNNEGWYPEIKPRGGSIRIRAGIIRRCMGRGWYEIDMVNSWNGDPQEPAEWIDGSQIFGSACEDSGSGCDTCEEIGYVNCDNLDAESGQVPMDRPVPVTENIVYGHTARQLVAKVGGMVKMIFRPEQTNDGELSLADSGSGDDPYFGLKYDIIDIEMPLKKVAVPIYDVCTDPLTGTCTAILVRTEYYLVEGNNCLPVEGEECDGGPTSSGTPSGES